LGCLHKNRKKKLPKRRKREPIAALHSNWPFSAFQKVWGAFRKKFFKRDEVKTSIPLPNFFDI
jgi:hypothetical protein